MSTANGAHKGGRKVWSQIGKTHVKVLCTCTVKKKTYFEWKVPLQVFHQCIESSKSINIIQLSVSLLGIDVVGSLQETCGYRYIATAIYYFSKYIEAKPIRTKSADEIALFLYELICQYRSFDSCLSDQSVFIYLTLCKYTRFYDCQIVWPHVHSQMKCLTIYLPNLFN